jgi:outer membrane receptor protein involved in Fe transport
MNTTQANRSFALARLAAEWISSLPIRGRTTTVALTVLPFGLAFGQSAPVPTTGTTASNDTVVLSPFTVNTAKDEGFVATSALAGGRLSTPLKDTPVAYSVVTKEFLDAFNVNDLTEAVQWSVNTTYNPGNNTDQGFGFSPAINITMRGAAPSESNYPMRNFFPYNSNTDSYALDRFDFARGPNAILFGAAQFGGTPSAITKQALTGRSIREIKLQFGSWNHGRATIDINQPINHDAAIRAAAMWDRSDTWRDYEWKRKKGIFLTGTYNLSPNTTLRAEGEYTEGQAKIFPTHLADQVSAWDGKTTFAGAVLPANAPTAAQQAAAGISYGTSNANPFFAPLYVYDPSAFGTSNVLNFANMFRTKGAAGNGTPANANFIGGKQIVNPNVSYAGAPMLEGFDIPSGRYDTDLAGSPYFQIPQQKTTNLWTSDKPTQSQVGKDFQLTLNHHFGDSWFFEIAGDTNKVKVDGNNAVNRGLNTVFIDINQTLPTGATNPEFKHPYTEYWSYENIRWYELRSIRAQAAYVKEVGFGKLQVGVIAGANYQRQEKRSYLYLLPVSTFGPDARYLDANQGSVALWNRLYLDQGGRDFYNTNLGPVTIANTDGTTTTVTPKWVLDASRKDNSASNITKFKFAQAATNLSLFHNRVVLIGAVRRDLTTLLTRNTLLPGDYPTGWDGANIIFKPDAPKDWATLTYIPKDANGNPTGPALPADSRPRLTVPATTTTASSNILRAPQYATDRFRDDYNPPSLGVAVNTYSFGGTINVTDWLGVYGNAATTFNPNLLIQRLDGSLLTPTAAHGTDVGLRFNPRGGHVSASLGMFHSYQVNSPVNPAGNFINDYNAIYSAPIVGDLSPSGHNIRNADLLPAVVRDTQTQQSHGVEFELTANLTRSWRLLANAAYTRAWQTNTFPDSVAYAAKQDAVARQILADAGVQISSANVATINPALNDPTKINVAAVTNAVNAWNQLQTSVFPNMVTGRQKLAGSVEQTANIGTDYTFHEGTLKGLVVGFGVHYRGRMVVGYRGSDTIVNPANPAQAIDDPTVDAYTSVFSKPYTTADARLGYAWKLSGNHTLRVDLNVNNVFNRRTPIYFLDVPGAQVANTTLRPRNGDVTSPAVETVPAGYSWLNPINFTLGATLSF